LTQNLLESKTADLSMPANLLTRDELLQDFARLKIFQRGEQRAIHKPLLILFALGRISRDEARLMDFAAIEADFKKLLQEFGPSSAPSSRHYPFWHLATDSAGGLWELEGPRELLSRPRGVTPNLTELRDNHVRGGFTPRVFEALSKDAVVRSELARIILEAHFPESLHQDLIAETGIVLQPESAGGLEVPVSARRRDPSFRERVLRAYEYRCCVCGFDLRIGSMSAGLEAAHIQWFQAEGPDTETNGMALCSLHHKIFDLGAFTVDPSSLTLVFSQQVTMGDATRAKFLSHHGAGMILPQSKSYYPKPQHLEWHAHWVFKAPGRDL
jgi:putative restriction endonuclease